MSLYEPVFTNSVKDVIGNEPVLDQFDIFYEASYYGTSQDDYVTGSLLKITTSPSTGKKVFNLGLRGRIFSKYYASSQPELESSYGSDAVEKIPSLSYRLQKWSSKTSRSAYRIAQCFDVNERYYDSCIPDVKACFKSFDARVWSITSNKSQFSPYANVVTGSTGYLLFDSIEFDRSSDGFDNDPTTINGWTRSFPYETRYKDARRLVSSDSLLGLGEKTLEVDWGRRPKHELLMPTVTQGFFPFVDKMYDITRAAGKEDIDISNVRVISSKPINNFVPIIPGYMEPINGSSFINCLRSKVVIDGGYGEVPVNMGSYLERPVERETGFSLLFPTDVQLNKKVDHTDYLLPYSPSVSDPGLEYLTSSIGTSDLVKFLFGFGDLNNVTYGRREYDQTKIGEPKYTESFENYSEGTRSTSLSNYRDQYFDVKWNLSYAPEAFRAWRVATRDDVIAGTYAGDPNDYYFKSGSKPDAQKGVKWLYNPEDLNILVSATSKHLNSAVEIPSGALGSSGEFSVTWVEITSSYPWTFSFDRAVCGDTSDKLNTAFEGVPGFSFEDLAYPLIPIDEITGSVNPVMTTYKYELNGTYQGSSDNKDYPLPPGRWRLKWQFTSGSGTTNNPSYAAINNFKLYSYADLEKKSMIGSNNLPDFSLKKSDNRLNPTLTVSPALDGPLVTNNSVADLHFSSSADIYNSYVFGIGPVIRGWKYGLINGFPAHSKSIFRRGRYGQFRDMLEQRHYTKFVSVNVSPTDEDATTNGEFDKSVSSALTLQNTSQVQPGPAAAEVKFVKKVVVISPRGIGTLETRLIDPEETTSQNLSREAVSTLPYFDDVPRNRTRIEAESVLRSSFVEEESTTSQLGNLPVV